jgi:hypothetical protein
MIEGSRLMTTSQLWANSEPNLISWSLRHPFVYQNFKANARSMINTIDRRINNSNPIYIGRPSKSVFA